jgi:hypothetical protein
VFLWLAGLSVAVVVRDELTAKITWRAWLGDGDADGTVSMVEVVEGIEEFSGNRRAERHREKYLAVLVGIEYEPMAELRALADELVSCGHVLPFPCTPPMWLCAGHAVVVISRSPGSGDQIV